MNMELFLVDGNADVDEGGGDVIDDENHGEAGYMHFCTPSRSAV